VENYGRLRDAVAQAVSYGPLTSQARVRYQVNPYEICGRQSGSGTGFFPSTAVSACLYFSSNVTLSSSSTSWS
jgi:hypothetical protein